MVFDGVGGAAGEEALGLLRAGGRASQYGMASGAYAAVPPGREAELLRGVALTPDLMRALSAAALALTADGTLRPTIGQVVDLERAADAHAAIEARLTVGKTLLRC